MMATPTVRTLGFDDTPGDLSNRRRRRRVLRALRALFNFDVPASKAAKLLRKAYSLAVEAKHVEAIRRDGDRVDLTLLNPAERKVFLLGTDEVAMERMLQRPRVRRAFGRLEVGQ